MGRRHDGQSRDPRKGRHRKTTSPETAAWDRDHLIPERPSWMRPDTYAALARLRDEVNLSY